MSAREASLVPRRPRCPVCAQDIRGAATHCELCASPHHEDCFRYFGGCGIFACRDGHPPTRLEIESWPEVAQHFAAIRGSQRHELVGLAGVAISGLVFLMIWCTPKLIFSPAVFIAGFYGSLLGAMLGSTYTGYHHHRSSELRSAIREHLVAGGGADLDDIMARVRATRPTTLPRLPGAFLLTFPGLVGMLLVLGCLEVLAFQMEMAMLGGLFFFSTIYATCAFTGLQSLWASQLETNRVLSQIEASQCPTKMLKPSGD